MKLSSLFALFITCSIITVPALAQDAVRPNPQVEAKAAQALVDYEKNVLHFTKERYYSEEGYYIGQLNDVAILLARLGRTQRALEVVDNIERYQESVSEETQHTRQQIIYWAVLRSAKFGNIDNATQLIPQIKKPMDRANALLALRRAYLRRQDYQAARKVLLQVSPLVKDNVQATAYSAYLFSQAGDMAAAQRLFARAIKALPPLPVESPSPSPKDDYLNDDYDDNFRVLRYLLKAGFVKEWWKAYQQHNSTNRVFVNMENINQLLALHRTDLALQLAQRAPRMEKFGFLIFISLQLPKDKTGVEQSKSLLLEVEDIYRSWQKQLAVKAPGESKEDQYFTREKQSIIRNIAIVIAYAYGHLGDKLAAQKWTKVATDGLSPDDAATWHVRSSLMPIVVQRDFHMKLFVTPSRLLEINTEIAPYVSRLHNPQIDFHLLENLVEEQIKVGQLEQAQPNLEVLEKLARKKMNQPDQSPGFFDFDDAMQTAKLWKKMGNDARAQKLLTDIWQAPAHEPKTKLKRAQWLIKNGFVDQGLRYLKSQPEGSTKSKYYRILATAEAKFRPNTFPDWITEIKDPTQRLQVIGIFTGVLTRPIFYGDIVLTESGGNRNVRGLMTW